MTLFIIAIAIILYSYSIFTLGLISALQKVPVGLVSAAFFFFLCIIIYQKRVYASIITNFLLKRDRKDKVTYYSMLLSALILVVNFIGALSPELSFDALWYHLTIPKLYIMQEKLSYIPGGLFYYSVMPKIIDVLYIVPLLFFNEIGAKIIHYMFGIGTCISLYVLSRQFVSQKISSLVLLIFLSNLVVSWEMTVAYIDLGRTFFETLCVLGLVLWMKKKKNKYLYLSGLMLGAAVASKYLALVSVLISITLVIFILLKKYKITKQSLTYFLIYLCCMTLIPLPWLIFAYIHTGNPLYPSFSTSVNEIIFSWGQLVPWNIIKGVWNMFMNSSDPISPIYVVMTPLIFMQWKKFGEIEKFILFYSVLAILFLYFLPQIGGGRFLLAYLPLFSLLCGITLAQLRKKRLERVVIGVIFFLGIITVGYRSLAQLKYVPVIIGVQSKDEFLSKNLNFSFGDYYDVDNYMQKTIKEDETVLVIGSHNLYYMDFPFIHESYVKKGDTFNYILVQQSILPERFKNFNKIYSNKSTGVDLYSSGGKKWIY